MLISKGFEPKRQSNKRLPPGQYETKDFPVLSLGPTPDIDIAEWTLEVSGLVGKPQKWNWQELSALPHEDVIKDIHCVTKWSKFDSKWSGIQFDSIMKIAEVDPDHATHIVAHSYDGYTTNLPVADLIGGKAWIATAYDGEAIEAEHGGPARIFVPHLYFWKSAKWLKKIEFVDRNMPGFWETRGYHDYGDPWQEQRYTND